MQRPDHPHHVVTAPPPGPLEGAVWRLSGYAETTAGPLRRRELPWPGVVLIVNTGPALEVDGVAHGSFLAGPSTGPSTCVHGGHQAGMQVDLTPMAAHALLGGLPMHELADAVVPLDDLLGRALTEDVGSAATYAERFSLVARRLAPIAGRPPSPDVAYAWRRLHETRGTATVTELCRELGCSRRHLARRFRAEVGLPPKRAARLFRFQHALTLLDAGTPPGEAALAAGFSDHAHLDRDFRELAGAPPTTLLTERHGTAFPFVQDAAPAAA